MIGFSLRDDKDLRRSTTHGPGAYQVPCKMRLILLANSSSPVGKATGASRCSSLR